MTKQQKIRVAKISAILSVIPAMILAFNNGPDAGSTGAVAGGEPAAACAQAGCHVGTGNPTAGSGVEIDFPEGLTYTPGQKQALTIRVTGAQTRVYGFQMSARLASNERTGQAGDLAPSAGEPVQVVCQDNRPVKPCRADAPVQFAMHTMPRSTNSFKVDWTPPATDSGNVRIYVAGNAANGDTQNTGDRIFLRNYTLTPRAGISGLPVIREAQPVLQAFDNSARISSGTYVQIFGSNLAGTTRSWGGADFNGPNAPTVLDTVRVNVNNKPAYVSFISPGQINVQTPDDPAEGPVQVEVVHSGGTGNKVTLTKTKVSPTLLTTPAFNVGGKQYLAALHTDLTTFVGPTGLIAGVAFRPARVGDIIIAYALGCGPTNPASPAGQIVSGLNFLASPVQVRFGETVAQAQGFMEPNFVGLCRFNITVPNVTGDAQGDIRIEATVDAVATGQTLFTTVQR